MHPCIALSVIVLSLACTSCGTPDAARISGAARSQSNFDILVDTKADGVELALPADANGPQYDSDDYFRGRPTWRGPGWHVHFVYGNGGLTQYMDRARCFSVDDELMRRKVCIGRYVYYGAMADISRVATPDHVTSMQVTIGPSGPTEAQAVAIVQSAITTWELSLSAD